MLSTYESANGIGDYSSPYNIIFYPVSSSSYGAKAACFYIHGGALADQRCVAYLGGTLADQRCVHVPVCACMCVCVCVVHRGVLADQRCACGCHGGSAGGCRGLTSRHNLTPVLILLPPSRTRTHHIILPSPRNCSPPSPLCSSLQTILMPMANAQLMKINSNSTFYSYQWRWAGQGGREGP